MEEIEREMSEVEGEFQAGLISEMEYDQTMRSLELALEHEAAHEESSF